MTWLSFLFRNVIFSLIRDEVFCKSNRSQLNSTFLLNQYLHYDLKFVSNFGICIIQFVNKKNKSSQLMRL